MREDRGEFFPVEEIRHFEGSRRDGRIKPIDHVVKHRANVVVEGAEDVSAGDYKWYFGCEMRCAIDHHTPLRDRLRD